MGQGAILGIVGFQSPYESTDQALCGILKETGGAVFIRVPMLHEVFQKDPRHLVHTFLIGQVFGRNGIDPVINGAKGNDPKRDLFVLPERVGHFRDLKILVIVDDPGKPFLSEMLQQSIDDTFGLSAASGGHYGNPPTDIAEDQPPSPYLQFHFKDLGWSIGILMMIHQTKDHCMHKKQWEPKGQSSFQKTIPMS